MQDIDEKTYICSSCCFIYDEYWPEPDCGLERGTAGECRLAGVCLMRAD